MAYIVVFNFGVKKTKVANKVALGKVYLVGAGPGDAELLTIKAVRILRKADVVIYDHLVNPEILKYTLDEAVKISVGEPRKANRKRQAEITQLMISKAREQKTVVRLKGGDPFIFGRGAEEALALSEAGIPYEAIPGISSGFAVPAYAGIPLTHRCVASSVAFVTGHEQASKSFAVNWSKLATGVDTLVIFMGLSNLERIVTTLMEAGRSPLTPIAVIERGTFPNQQVFKANLRTILSHLSDKALSTPVLIVVGEVVSFSDSLFQNHTDFKYELEYEKVG